MRTLEPFVNWHVSSLRMEPLGFGEYVVRELRSGRYEAEVRVAPGLPWECIGTEYETAGEAVRACERDLFARTGGDL